MKSLIAFAAVAVLCFSGCVSNPIPPADRRVTVAEDLGTDVYVTDVRCVKTAGGYLTFQANVVNNAGGDLGVEWKVQWLDADGLEMESVVSSWNKVMIAAKDIKGLQGTAPSQTAADMRFYVRRLR